MSSSEVAARGMDLTRAAFEIVNKTGVAGALVGKVMKWLAREGIDESEFENCLGTLKQVVFPNDFGLEIRRNLERGDTRVKAQPYVGILNIVRGGSIGRWMTDVLKYCWLVTTVVALFRTHLNIGYIADAVCDMILDGGDHADGVKYKYRYEKTRMLPVVTKIVDSILLNIVNCGTTLEMPEELRDVDRHVVNHETFAAVTMTVYRAEGNVIVRSKKFPIDVYLWLCAHVEGTISTSIYGKIIHRLKIGSSQKTIDFVVDEIGQGEGFTFGSKEAVAINISGAKLETLLRHTSPDYERSSPNIRQPLYNFCLRNQLKRQDLLEIKMVGQRIVKWIMDHPITSIHESEWIEYKTHRPRDNGSMSLTLATCCAYFRCRFG